MSRFSCAPLLKTIKTIQLTGACTVQFCSKVSTCIRCPKFPLYLFVLQLIPARLDFYSHVMKRRQPQLNSTQARKLCRQRLETITLHHKNRLHYLGLKNTTSAATTTIKNSKNGSKITSSLPTLPMTPPAIASRGLTERMTRVSSQPFTKPTTKPAMKVQKYWKNNDNLSPIPASI